jgi:hypothetical protein
MPCSNMVWLQKAFLKIVEQLTQKTQTYLASTQATETETSSILSNTA